MNDPALHLTKGTRGKIKESEFAEALKKAFPHEGEKAMRTMIDSWIQEGEQKGRQGDTAVLTLQQLRHRFGAVDADTEVRAQVLSFKQLGEAGFQHAGRTWQRGRARGLRVHV